MRKLHKIIKNGYKLLTRCDSVDVFMASPEKFASKIPDLRMKENKQKEFRSKK